ncbi:MAG: hypothetical protein LBG06_06580, partial [Deltaproteobacteria bacterium]|nr:hypothetical protein [Deltaproteobacteria bacterium]
MSNELTEFLNFSFENRRITTKVVDDYSKKVTSAVRWQLNWQDYTKRLAETGVCIDPDLRPSLRRYASPQASETLCEDLCAFQGDLRRTAREIIRTRRVTPELWRRILRESEGFVSVLSPGTAGFEGEITPDNIGDLRLSYTYDTPVYRNCIMAILRDLVTNGDIFLLEEDGDGVFSLPAPETCGRQAPAAPRREAIPLKEALSRASGRCAAPAAPTGPEEPRGPVTFSLMSELSDFDLEAALADTPADPDDLPLTLAEALIPAKDGEPLPLTERADAEPARGTEGEPAPLTERADAEPAKETEKEPLPLTERLEAKLAKETDEEPLPLTERADAEPDKGTDGKPLPLAERAEAEPDTETDEEPLPLTERADAEPDKE